MNVKKFRPKRILFYHPFGGIGDVVLVSPTICALKNSYPEATIDLMVIPSNEEIAHYIPNVNQVIVYDHKGRDRNFKQFMKLKAFLHSQRYDLAITTNHSTRNAIVTWISGARCRIGSPEQGGFLFLTHPVRKPTQPIHLSQLFLEYIKPLGITSPDSKLALNIKAQYLQSVKQKLIVKTKKPIVALCPFGSWPQKSWTIEQCADLLRKLSPIAELYLIGGKKDRFGLETINNLSGGIANVLAGELNIGELIALIKLSDLVVTVDTGPLHIASALSIPVVALYGPTEYYGSGPRGPNDIIVIHQFECKPCTKEMTCENNRCMQAIQAEEVYIAVQKILTKLKKLITIEKGGES